LSEKRSPSTTTDDNTTTLSPESGQISKGGSAKWPSQTRVRFTEICRLALILPVCVRRDLRLGVVETMATGRPTPEKQSYGTNADGFFFE
jgi:hypothetical protein